MEENECDTDETTDEEENILHYSSDDHLESSDEKEA